MADLVFSSGNKESNIVFIGEAPGYKEAQTGKPFVGRSGQLLTDLMAKVGLQRKQVYITNVVKEKPHKNNIKPFIDSRKGVVSKKGQVYIDMLREELEKLNPNVIVPIGNTALWVLTGETGVTNWRGSILESTFLPGKKVIPIIHPAAALRMYIYRHFIQHDLNRIKVQSQFPEINRKDREYIIEPGFDESIAYIENCLQADAVGFDIEVFNYEVDCISFAPSEHEAISIPFVKNARNYFNPDQELTLWNKITDLLQHPEQTHIAQNAIFDCSFLYKKYGIRVSNIEDTMVAQGVAFPEFPKGLDFLTSIHTDVPYYKEDGKFKNPSITNEAFWLYNAKDSVVLPEIFRKQVKELEKLNLLETYRRQVSIIPSLVFMMEKGIKIDIDKKEEKFVETEQKIVKLQQELNEIAGEELNPNSPKQLKEYFYIKKGLKPHTKKGKVTTDEQALKQLSGKGHKEAKILLELRHYKTLNSRYYGMLLDNDGRLRCSFNPVGTTSGRLSSSKTIFKTGANLQNQPLDMKLLMLPDDGYIVYEVDLSQAENRVVAYIGPDMNMINAFEDGADIHSRTASDIFGIPEDEIIDMEKEYKQTGDKKLCAPIGHGDKTYRFWGKTANHAFNYDLGYVSFAKQYEIPRKDSKFIHSGYHRAHPGVKKMHSMVKNQLRSSRTLMNLLGRKRLFMDRWGDSLFKEAYSFIPQSTVADVINKYGLLELFSGDPVYQPVELLNQVHDSIIFQIPDSIGMYKHYLILKRICQSLEVELQHHGRRFRIPAEVTAYTQNFKDGTEIGRLTALEEHEAINEIKKTLQIV